MAQPHNIKLSEEHSHINRPCFLSGSVLWDPPWAAASYSSFGYKDMTVKVFAIFKSCQCPMLSNSALRNLNTVFLRRLNLLKIIKFEIILLPISFQVLGDMRKHFHMTFQDSDSEKVSSNKNLPQNFTQPICLWEWFYKIIKEFGHQQDPRHA